jgi:hypothetical protein
MTDRYVIRELEGYSISPSARTAGSQMLGVDVYIFDTWYGFQLVASYKSGTRRSLDKRRVEAAERCAELNAESEAANLRSMQAATVGESEQSREGKAI